MRVRSVAVAGIALSLVVGTAVSPAAADYGTNIPPAANAAEWQARYRDTPADWRPQGTLVTDSTFRAYPDGLGFYNFGGVQRFNAPIFGIPAAAPGISSDAMRSLMGPAVCLENNESGPCTLTLPAQQWKTAIDENASGGHCYGLASTASMLHNGTLTPGQFQTGVTRTYDLAPLDPILQEINRNMASQYTTDLSKYLMKPSEFVTALRQNLGGSQSPYVGLLLWATGGHAVTPYAVYDRGAGKFDVAVYDNNYPDAGRAIHVDTVNETFQYLVSSNPSAPPVIADGQIGLMPVSEIAKRQKCAFCLGTDTVTVNLAPVKSDAPIKTRVLNLKGKPLKGVKKAQSLEPWQPGGLWHFPTYEIPRGKEFILKVNAKKRKKVARLDITAVTGEFTFTAQKVKVPKRSIGLLGVSPKTGKFIYAANARDLGKIGVTDQRANDSTVQVSAAAKGKSAPLGARIDQQHERVVLQTLDRRKGRAAINAEFIALDASQNKVRVTATASAKLPKRARAIVKYAQWSLSETSGVKLVIRKANGKTRTVPMHVKMTTP